MSRAIHGVYLAGDVVTPNLGEFVRDITNCILSFVEDGLFPDVDASDHPELAGPLSLFSLFDQTVERACERQQASMVLTGKKVK